MRKKLWLLALPILLCSAIFWARDAAWKGQEASLRRVVETYLGKGNSIVVSAPKAEGGYFVNGNWAKADFLVALERIKLKRSETSFIPDNSMLTVIFDAGNDSGAEWGFYLSQKEDRGWIHLAPVPPDDQWKGCELTPDTCRALKKRIFTLQSKDGRLFSPK